MSQANWSEFIAAPPLEARERRSPVPPGLVRFLADWESWLTLGLVMLVFLSVARSVDAANWVPQMPSIFGISFLAILAGYLLARVEVPGPFLHLAAIALGFPVVLLLVLRFMDAPSLGIGLEEIWERWRAWVDVVRSGGISSDTMPFVTLVLALAWIAGYLSSWAIFRWRNAWLALVPAGFGLLTNISYQPGQFSADFVVFLFGGMLLVMRVHMMRKIDEWKRTHTPYPDFLSLTLLNVTTWVAIAALVIAWTAPQANEVGFLSNSWNKVAGPFSSDADTFTRLFSGIDSKKEVPLHTFGDSLPLQGRVVLSSKIVAQADFGEGSNHNRPIRAAVYDEYISQGWRAGPRRDVELGPTEQVTPSSAQKAQFKDRLDVAVNVVTESGTPRRTLLGVGSPVSVSINSKAEVANADTIPDLAAVRARKDQKSGDVYVANSTVSSASEEKLKNAGADYPQYVKDRYLQLPVALPQRVRELAVRLTQDRRTPFEKAKAIEEFLRTFPATYDIRAVPPNKDAVEWFLFEEKRGYSDYQASAMVVLLRAAGVPARMAVGYNVDEFDLSLRRFILRDSHAYAWPEVYFPTYGWEEFAPYGEANAVTRAVSDGAEGDTNPGDDGLISGLDEPDFGEIPEDGVSSGPFTTDRGSRWTALLPLLYALLALVAVGSIVGLGVRFVWERGMKGLDYPTQLWEKTIRLTSWLRIGPKPSQTPREYSRALQQSLPGTEGVDRVTASYLRSRYGARTDISETEREDLAGSWQKLRNTLLKKVARLK